MHGILKMIGLIHRVMGRSMFFLFMTVLGFSGLELLVYLGRTQGYDFMTRFPELTMILRAVTILAWLEMSVMWIRLMAQPNVNVQTAACDAVECPATPMASAVIYGIHTFAWAFRLLLLMKLCEML